MRKLTSHKRREAIVKLAKELTEEKEDELAPLIEQRLAAAPKMPSEEQLLVAMNTKKIKNNPIPKKGGQRTFNPRKPKSSMPIKHRTKIDSELALENMQPGPTKEETVRAAAQAAILMGQPPNLVAAQYGINQGSVEGWADIVAYTKAIARRDILNDILMAFIQQEFKSLMAISLITEREEWVLLQSAGELADFLEVKADKLLTVLSALGRSQQAIKNIAAHLETVDQNG